MCVTRKTSDDSGNITFVKTRQEEQESYLSRKCGWFSVRYFNSVTPSGDRARYVFVNASQYGIVWGNVAFFIIMHWCFFYALQKIFEERLFEMWVCCYVVGLFGGIGVTGGAHRLWSHKTYEASLPVRLFLMVCFTSAGQNDLFTWARDHRLHHKYTETDADPHNSRRGGFFAHVGWLLTKKHPDVIIKGATIDNSDLMRDPVVAFNRRFYIWLYLFFRVYVTIIIPKTLVEESLFKCSIGCFATYVGQLHTVWFVNSAAHIFGHRPYNSKIQPRENWWVAVTGMGEGFHNYHHTFPWDYAIAENGLSYWNPAKWFIDLMFALGLCSNLKRASNDLVRKTMKKVGGDLKDQEFYVHDHPYTQPHGYTDGA